MQGEGGDNVLGYVLRRFLEAVSWCEGCGEFGSWWYGRESHTETSCGIDCGEGASYISWEVRAPTRAPGVFAEQSWCISLRARCCLAGLLEDTSAESP